MAQATLSAAMFLLLFRALQYFMLRPMAGLLNGAQARH